MRAVIAICILALGYSQQALAKRAADELPDLLPIGGDGWQMLIRDTDHAWGVLVLAPPDKCSDACDQAKKAFQSVVKSLEAMVFIGTSMYDDEYDAEGEEAQKVFERFNLSATDAQGNIGVKIPSLVFFIPGPRGVQPSEIVLPPDVVMQLAASKPRAIVEQIKAFFPHAMTSVTTSSISRFLAQSSTQPRRKLLVVSSKTSPALQGRKLSLDVLYGADTGLVMAKHSTVIDLLPGVVPDKGGVYLSKEGTLPAFGTDAADIDPLSVEWIPYQGKGGAFHPMQQWVLGHLGRARIPILTSQARFDEACVEQGGICVVIVMPRGTAQETIPEGKQLPEDSYINTAVRAAERIYGKVDTGSLASGTPTMEVFPVRFVQVDGGSQAAWASAFDVSAPSAVAVNARTKRFAAFTGPFTPPSIHDFVLDVINGKVALGKADDWPALATTSRPDVTKNTRMPRQRPKRANTKAKQPKGVKRDEL